ncbi:MAG: hypothetical protein ACRBCK_07505 [Alphaproteobacteria bacterium]
MSNRNSSKQGERDMWLVDCNEKHMKAPDNSSGMADRHQIDFDLKDVQYLDMVERSDVDAQSDIWEIKLQDD